MGKKSTKNSSRHQEKMQQIPSLVKILRPKVYITDTTNFKKLVQQLTGKSSNSNSSSPISSPPPYVVPSEAAPFMVHDDALQEGDYYYTSFDSLSLDSACFSVPLEMEAGSSPEFGSPDSLNMQERPEKIDLSWQYRELESFLMEMENTNLSSSYNYDASCYGYGMVNNATYQYSGLSSFIL